jgi:hypothetical protein
MAAGAAEAAEAVGVAEAAAVAEAAGVAAADNPLDFWVSERRVSVGVWTDTI